MCSPGISAVQLSPQKLLPAEAMHDIGSALAANESKKDPSAKFWSLYVLPSLGVTSLQVSAADIP